MNENNSRVMIIWTTDNKETALNTVFMYAKNAVLYNWLDEVELIIWGPSSRLTVEDEDIQEELKVMANVGVKIKACVACASRYGVKEKLRELGFEVIPMGPVLSEEIKSGRTILTF